MSMSAKEIMEEILDEIEIPHGYGDLTDPVSPFISWSIGDTVFTASDEYAGLTTRADTVTVELYTTGKDWETEDRLEALIERFSPRKHEEMNYYESVYQITYTFTITTKNRRT